MQVSDIHNPKRVFDYISNLTNRGDISQNDLAAFRNGKFEINPSVLYVRDNISSKSGVHKLIEPSDSYAVGTTNIDKAQLPAGNYFFIERIRLAAGVSSADPDGVSTYTTDRDSFDPALYAGHFKLEQRGRKLVELPISAFTSGAPASDSNAFEQGIVLPDIKHLVPQQTIGMEIEFVGSTVGNEVIEVSLIGRQTELKV